MTKWFGVKGLYRWFDKATGQTLSAEERVVLFSADSHAEAVRAAELEAPTYCSADPSANFVIEPMEWDSYEIGEREPNIGVDVYSRLMDTSLSRDTFLRRYFSKSQDHSG